MRIEELEQKDFADWAPLWAGYLTFYKADLTAAATSLTFARLIDPTEQMGGFIARDEFSTARGIVHWIDHRSCWTTGDYCYLQDLFVADAVRGRGVGTGLIEAVSSAASLRGCSRVYWITHETNLAAQDLYNKVADRSGFIQYVRKLA
ncbi:GNAT family N-acetyltransferase [Rhodoblastus sp.]|jgi:GNAT superfamily N-acetyltransferase|uniref:GNAT family N-acetyltransferase n=1 Tax=Rhodoblastus sp. TaxID=1962975 RepID=UPI0025E4743A|nr:GNAT family N-acetyltransferase [Rhodoblastus sp.]